MTPRRARNDQARLGRRRQLLDAAAARFDAAGYTATTMAEVATAAGLAKGTTYLYFRSKEELFLDLLLDELGDWAAVAAAEAEKAEKAEKGSPGRTAAALAATLAERRRLVRLLALRAPVLEPGAGGEATQRFRGRQLARLEPLGNRLEALFPALGAEGGLGAILRLLALATGYVDRLDLAAGNRESSAAEARREISQRDFTLEVSSSMELFLSASKPAATPPAP
jgi:AcrR family transcriptional regulator